MSGDISEHLEHAEHAAHGSHGNGAHGGDTFMLRVAMSMAVIAAALATVSVKGHQKHNQVLQSQGDANQLMTESAALKVESSNTFARFQSKKGRMEEQERAVAFTKLFAAAPGSEAFREEQVKKWESYIAKNKSAEKEIKVDATGFPVKNDDGSENDSTGALIVTGKRFQQMAEEKVKAADAKRSEGEHAHHQADGLDWAHLTLELGLVLCTVSVLTKNKVFWLIGIFSALSGGGLAIMALLFMH